MVRITYPVRWAARLLKAGCGYAAAVPLLEWCFDPHATASHLFTSYLFSIVYGICIGGILTIAVPLVWTRTFASTTLTRWLLRISVVAAGTVIGCLLAGLVPLAIYGSKENYWLDFLYSFRVGLILSTVAVAFVSMYETYKGRLQATLMELKTKELERERALKLATEARLSSLESRIHPHFLFNTINSVSSLIPEDPRRAERMLTQMASLLRFSLDSAQVGLVPLGHELKIVEDYLEIETARFGTRLRHSFAVDASVREVYVPPLSVQTLVENSVKYAVGPRREGAAIRVSARGEGAHLLLEVWDDGPGFTDLQFPPGHGLSNLQERLQALFGDEARLYLPDADGTTVRIELPLESAMRAPAGQALSKSEQLVKP